MPENSQSREKIREINRLWVEYSNGIFGFSVQKDIYAQEGGEIKDNPFNEKVWKNFLREIDWASLTSSFTLLQPQFSLDGRTEKGHLPYWYKWNQDELREDLHNSSEESILVKELGFLVLFYIVESIFD